MMQQLLDKNQKLFSLMRTCRDCKATEAGVYPCGTHLPMVRSLNAEWAINPSKVHGFRKTPKGER